MATTYTSADWAQFFMLAATNQIEKAKEWLIEYSNHNADLESPDEGECDYAIREAILFLDKFAENWADSVLKRSVREEQIKRIRSRKSDHPDWNPNDPQFW